MWRPSNQLAFAGLIVLHACVSGCAKQPTFPTEDTITPGIFLDAESRGLPRGVEPRKVNARGIELTKLSEGFRSYLYNDAAQYCTIAYGHLIKLAPCDGTEPQEFRDGVTVEVGTELLRVDMEKAEVAVLTLTSAGLNDNQFAALCDFVYNVGSGNFRSSTLRKVINAGDYDRVAFELSRWVRAGEKVLNGLKIRRKRETELFYDGIDMPRARPRADEEMSFIDIRLGEDVVVD